MIITVLASRSGLKHGAAHGKQLITLASKRLSGLHPGTARFAVAVGDTGRRALSTYRRLASKVEVKVTAPGSKTVTFTKGIVLRAG